MVENSQLQYELEKQAEIDSKVIFKGRIITLKRECFQIGDKAIQFDIIVHPGAVAIIPINEKGHLLLVKQWRRAIQKIILEIPAGTIEKGEDPYLCAQRELQEEIGYQAATLIPLGGYQIAPGYSSEYLHLFIAQGLTSSQLTPDDGEYIDVVELSLDQVLTLIDEHQIEDVKTIAAILQYQRWRNHGGSKEKN